MSILFALGCAYETVFSPEDNSEWSPAKMQDELRARGAEAVKDSDVEMSATRAETYESSSYDLSALDLSNDALKIRHAYFTEEHSLIVDECTATDDTDTCGDAWHSVQASYEFDVQLAEGAGCWIAVSADAELNDDDAKVFLTDNSVWQFRSARDKDSGAVGPHPNDDSTYDCWDALPAPDAVEAVNSILFER